MRKVPTTRLLSVLGAGLAIAVFGVSILGGMASAHGGWYDKKTYVALGDSVAAGVGLPQDVTATAEDKACGRSTEAYSQVLDARAGNWLRTKSVACTGASTANMSAPQTVGGVTVAPQLDVAFADGTPDYLSLTLGGNDIHWAEFIGSCYVSSCDTPANTAAADAYLAAFRTNLKTVFADIKARSHGRAPMTVLTGYYNPMSAACAAGPITGSEVAWVSAQVAKLNASIQSVADDYRYVAYAPLDFTGHDICSADTWLQRPGFPGETNPFHPNTLGQQQIAKAILRSL